ncbi:MAG: hypothetical protein ACQKBT_09745 [Puniceicoccales bacterium]
MKLQKLTEYTLMNYPCSILAIFTVTIATAATASAQEIVDWDAGDGYVSGWVNGTGLSGGTVPFSDTIARSPSSDYTGGTYYGGAIGDGTNGIQWWRVGTANMNFGGYTQENGDAMTAIYVWNQADFLNGYDTGETTISSFSADLYTSGSSQSQGYARWLIEVDSAYYVSDSFDVAFSTSTEYSLNDLSSVDWYSIDPTTSMTAVGSVWADEDFSNVTAVGLWYQVVDERTSVTGSVSGFGNIESFSVTAIPEPSTSSAIIASIILCTAIGSRRIRRKA